MSTDSIYARGGEYLYDLRFCSDPLAVVNELRELEKLTPWSQKDWDDFTSGVWDKNSPQDLYDWVDATIEHDNR